MALVLADRVQETSTSTGTGSFTLAGAVTGYQTFAVIGNGNTTFYTIADQGGANWEVGIGTYSTTGPTLARTTVLSNSNGNTSPVDFTAGTKTVFVTYPSEQSVNLDASGNVSALGTVSSGVWQGTTVGVAYGGTGVTASSGANSVVLRDANANITFNNFTSGFTAVTAAAGTTVLTVASTRTQVLIGSTTQTIQLPDATTLQIGQSFIFVNNSSGALTITNNASATIDIVPPGGAAQLGATSIATSAGSWGIYSFLPGTYNFSIPTADFGNATIIDAVWNGTTIGSAYGGTGLTTFTGANNALYSTSSSALTAGTLPVPAGGTGITSATANGVVYGNGTSALQITAAGDTGQVLLGNTGSAPSWGSVPAGSITGTVPIANGGTGQTTASAAFNALSPITTTGDLIVGNGSNSATRLGIGSTGQVLTVSGGTTVWSTPATGGGTITRTDFTATAGQTVFTVSYTVGLIDVYRNGVKLATTDFTATNGTSFTLAVAANAGDIVQAVVFSSLNLYSTITYQVFNGDGTTTVFTMSSVPANSASLLVAISGVVQDPGTYTVSSTTLTFLTAPPSGTGNISVRYLGIASVGTVGSFSAGTTGLTPSSATTGAVVLAGTLNVANGGTGATSLAGANIAVTNATNTFTADQSISGLTVGKGGGAVATNTALGLSALTAITSGSNNTGVGYLALSTNSTGANNSAFGLFALRLNTGGSNSAFGVQALDANTGSFNSAFGQGALQFNTTASNNTAVGYQAGYSNTTGTENTFIGYIAGNGTTTTSGQTFVGYLAGYGNSGSSNTSLGRAALSGTGSGSNNVAIGREALQSNTTASGNTAVGYQAGYSNTSSTNLVAIGYQAGYSSNANENTFVGYFAGKLTTGAGVTAIGTAALSANTSGGNNTAIGDNVMASNTTGANNVAVGGGNAGVAVGALGSNTTGSNNTALGYQAGYTNTTGAFNTYLGRLAGFTATGNKNTFVGNAAGYDITTGANNTILGGYTGNGGGLDIRTTSNFIVLSDGDGNPRVYWDNYGMQTTTSSYTDGYALIARNSQATRPYCANFKFTGASPNNTTQSFLDCEDTTNRKLAIFSDGTVTNRTGTYNSFSDIKLKQDVVDAGSQWADIKAVRVRKFRLKDDVLANPDTKPLIGVIAQELEQTSAGLIDDCYDKEGEVTKAVKYSILYMKAIKALQEAMERIETLEEKVTALENK